MKKQLLPLFYFLLLSLALLYPFDFDFRINNAQWLEAENGIHFKKNGLLVSEGNSCEFYEKLISGEGLTLEVWLKTDDLTQNGPARILSYSIDTTRRNFTLAQSKDKLVMRLRTQKTDPNALFPHMEVPHIFGAAEKIHIAVTYDFDRQCVFINGKKHTCTHVPKGNFSNWDPAFRLAIGNEVTGNRPWLGIIYYAAVYDYALNSGKITENFNQGIPVPEDLNAEKAGGITKPLVCYRFNEKGGNLVKDTGRGAISLDLHIPKRLPYPQSMLNISYLADLKNNLLTTHNLVHILIFIPFGIFLHRILILYLKSSFYAVSIVLIITLIVSFKFEILQHFLPSRTSSIIDIIPNFIGACFGIVLDYFLFKRTEGVKKGYL